MNLSDLGAIIKNRREFLKMRQEDLAEFSNVGMKTIHLAEQGKGNPSFKTLLKIGEVLGLEIHLTIKQPGDGPRTGI